MNGSTKLLVLVLLLGSSGVGNAREEQCLNSKKHVCYLPFSAIYLREERYAGATIGVKGFLQRESDAFVLYPDKMSMQYLVRESALELQGLDADGLEASDTLAHRFVEVVGVLSSPADSRYWAGLRIMRLPQEVPIAINGVIEPAPPRPVEKQP